MIFGYFILAVALLIEIVGAYYSITGLAAIFSGAVIPILIMGGSLEVGKVTAAVWLKNNWSRASTAYKLYLLPAVAMLMVITSMGIFGFLSKAHNDQNLVSGDVQAKISIYDEKINTAKENIDANRKILKQMDESVDQTMGRSSDEKGADKAVALRKSQAKERSRLLADIASEQKTISQLNDQAAPIRAEVRKVEAEVGPIKYIAKLIYGDNPDANILEKAVVWVIIVIVAVFDPLALVLILAAQQTIRWAQEETDEDEPEVQGPALAVEPVEETPPPQPEIDVEHVNQMLEEAKEIPEPMIPYQILEDVDEEAEVVAEPEPINEHPFRGKGLGPSIPMTAPYAQNEPVPVPEEEPIIEVLADTAPIIESHESPNAPGLDASLERPGDYITPPVYRPQVPEAAPARGRGVMHTHHLLADNNPALPPNSNRSDFGSVFPATPDKGDTYLRTDSLPNRLYKYNGQKWIEVDKNSTDTYAYNDSYIKHLINQIDAGSYDPDLLSDVEREQIRIYLDNNAQ
jgi:hypothetical protein